MNSVWDEDLCWTCEPYKSVGVRAVFTRVQWYNPIFQTGFLEKGKYTF